MQRPTKVYGRRAYGVGLLVAGYDVSWFFLEPRMTILYDFDIIFYMFSQEANILTVLKIADHTRGPLLNSYYLNHLTWGSLLI